MLRCVCVFVERGDMCVYVCARVCMCVGRGAGRGRVWWLGRGGVCKLVNLAFKTMILIMLGK